MKKIEKELYSRLLSEGPFSGDELKKAAKKAREMDVALHEYLLDNKRMQEDKLLSIISGITHIPFVNLHDIEVEEAAIKAVPAKFTWHYKFVPLSLESNKLTIAAGRPLSINVQDELKLILGYRLSVVLAKRDQVEELLKRHYGLAADTVDKMVERADGIPVSEVPELRAGIDDIEKLAGDASVIRLVNQIILEAYRKRATDIHIEPFKGKLRLRYRVDGVLQDQKVPEDGNRFIMPILSRVKIMSNLDIVERRVPQDGKTVVKVQDEVLDLRVSFMPTPHGESVVIRMLPAKTFFSLKKLGLFPKDMETFQSFLKKPNGIIFVTGPTGSGKTTTLYACLKEVNRNEKKIITIEDPIEYGIENVTQIQVNESLGLTFAKGLKSMLRHDPDIMMVGEVRDRETAEIAIRAALTGHLVLSTLHTNDTATSVTRLVDIGIEPYLVASSVEAFIAQRLIRVICPGCKTEDTDIAAEIREAMAVALDLGFEDDIRIFKGKGCEECNFTGFYGRMAIYEILVVDPEIKRLISERAAATDIKNKAIENGMDTLLQNGWRKVLQGITTPEEVLNVCQDMDVKIRKIPEDSGPRTRLAGNRSVDKRLYARVSARTSLRYRLIEKAEGEIIGLDRTGKSRPERGKPLKRKVKKSDEERFSEYLFAEGISGAGSGDEVYKEIFTSTANISAGGIMFESRYRLPVNSILEMKIDIPGRERPIECFAKIVRREKDLPDFFYVAACYMDMSGEDRTTIDEFVRRESARQKRPH